MPWNLYGMVLACEGFNMKIDLFSIEQLQIHFIVWTFIRVSPNPTHVHHFQYGLMNWREKFITHQFNLFFFLNFSKLLSWSNLRCNNFYTYIDPSIDFITDILMEYENPFNKAIKLTRPNSFLRFFSYPSNDINSHTVSLGPDSGRQTS